MKQRLILALLLLTFLFAAIAAPAALAAHEPENAEGCPEGPFDENGKPRSPEKCSCTYEDIKDDTYCLSGDEGLAVMIRDMARLAIIGAAKNVASFIWFLIRIVAVVCDGLLKGELWQGVSTDIFEQLESVLGGRGGVFDQLIGSSDGLFAIALMLAGLVMCFPMMASRTNNLVRVERVLPWGMLMLALFVLSYEGFNLIENIESLRIQMVKMASGIEADGESDSNVLNLVGGPMLATPEEVATITAENLRNLPVEFERYYFPQPNYITRRMVVSDMKTEYLDLIFPIGLLEPVRYDLMVQRASEAVFKVFISIMPLYVLTILAVIYLVLYAAAFALIVFFLAAMPLGFFEFGAAFLLAIIRQYVAVIAVSLFAAVFVRILTATTLKTVTTRFDFADLATYFGAYLLTAIMLTMVLKLAWQVMDGSLGTMQHSLSTVAAMAYSTSGPVAGTADAAGKVASTAVMLAASAATGGAVGLVVGGLSGAMAGGVGGLFSKSEAGGQAASFASTLLPNNQAAQIFSAVARSDGSPRAVAQGVVATRKKYSGEGSDMESSSFLPTYDHSHRLDPKWQAVDMGGYLTSDLGALERAERAHFQEHNPTLARRHLMASYGNAALADEVMGVYNERGIPGAKWVRAVTETAQIAAEETYRSGERLFDEHGKVTPAYRQAVSGEFERNGLTAPDEASYPTASRIVQATVRKPRNVWLAPDRAPRLLTRDTLDPELPEVQVGDTSAQYALCDLAEQEGWDEPQHYPRLDHVFRAYHAVTLRVPPAQIQPEQVYQEMQRDPMLAGESPVALQEAARLVVLVGGQAEVQHGEDDPERVVTVQPRETDEDNFIFSPPHSADLERRIREEIPFGARFDAEERQWQIEAAQEPIAREILADACGEYGWSIRHEAGGELPAVDADRGMLDRAVDATLAATSEAEHISAATPAPVPAANPAPVTLPPTPPTPPNPDQSSAVAQARKSPIPPVSKT